MNKFPFLLLLLSLPACMNTSPVTQHTPQAEIADCDAVADAVGAMVTLKWAERENTAKATLGNDVNTSAAINQSNSDDNVQQVADWRLLGLVSSDTFEQLGFTMQETISVAKQVHSTDISNEAEYDVLSYHALYKAQCELENENVEMLDFAFTSKVLDKCWFPVHNKGIEPEACFKQVISGKLVL